MFCHIDADAFFASVLQRKHPKLRGKPLLALGMGGGCVIAASYEAKAKGVKTGMRLVDARKLCKGAVEMPSDFEETAVASRQIASVLQEQCPVMEQMSVDEWFLDLRSMQGGLPDNLFRWAEQMQKDVQRRVGISVSAGIARSKLLAKMASEYHKPAGVTLITKENLEAFLRDRPAAAIPGIGRRRSLHAEANRWQTAWDIATANQEQVQRLFGKPGREIQRELLGTSVYGVEEDAGPPKSVSRCRSFRATEDKERIFSSILDHLSYTVLKMRRHGLMCREICVWLRDSAYEYAGHSAKLPQPMDTEEQMLPYARECFRHLWEGLQTLAPYSHHQQSARRQQVYPEPVEGLAWSATSEGKDGSRKENRRFAFHAPCCTQTGLALCNLRSKGSLQFSLFEDVKHAGSSEQMQEKLDELHERFGRTSVLRGSALPTKGSGKPHLHVL